MTAERFITWVGFIMVWICFTLALCVTAAFCWGAFVGAVVCLFGLYFDEG